MATLSLKSHNPLRKRGALPEYIAVPTHNTEEEDKKLIVDDDEGIEVYENGSLENELNRKTNETVPEIGEFVNKQTGEIVTEAAFRRDTDAGTQTEAGKPPFVKNEVKELGQPSKEDMKLILPDRMTQLKKEANELKDWCLNQTKLDTIADKMATALTKTAKGYANICEESMFWWLRSSAGQGQRDLIMARRMFQSAMWKRSQAAKKGEQLDVMEHQETMEKARIRVAAGFVLMKAANRAWLANSEDEAPPIIDVSFMTPLLWMEISWRKKQQSQQNKVATALTEFVTTIGEEVEF